MWRYVIVFCLVMSLLNHNVP